MGRATRETFHLTMKKIRKKRKIRRRRKRRRRAKRERQPRPAMMMLRRREAKIREVRIKTWRRISLARLTHLEVRVEALRTKSLLPNAKLPLQPRVAFSAPCELI